MEHDQRYRETDLPGHWRDQETGAILNRDFSKLQQYMQDVEKWKQHTELKRRVDTLQDDVSQIKDLLIKLVEKNGN